MDKKISVSIVKIDKEMINQRIDNFIKSQFRKIPKGLLYKIIRIGRIRVNKKRVKPDYKLKIGDILRIPPFHEKKIKKNITINLNIKKKLLSSILYEDEYLLVINKPPGIAVHGGSGLNFGIIEGFRLLKEKYQYLELIHRLDKNTSGILMLAKKKSCLKNIHEQFRKKIIEKQYIALVHGKWKDNIRIISKPLIKNKLFNGKKHVTISCNGKQSKTIFIVKKRFDLNTMLLIIPKTGRTHQIRVHAAYAGHPIIFDNYYGNKKLDYQINQKYQHEKILLHAIKISFFHPLSKKKIYIKAPLENRFKKYLK
ncbi:RluA family pseudouridine synthase [Buchnera aphidicola]|uniref:RluA family pseudouridine synthase n=1 Tax=Buchnera aphidicola TaxID=9 RepID=UPI003464D937